MNCYKKLKAQVGANLRQIDCMRSLVRFVYRQYVIVLSFVFGLLQRDSVHFLHIGKTGGTAIKHVLRKLRCGLGYFLFIHNHEFKLADVPKGDKVVFFIRDPIDRFVSGFNSRKREDKPRYYYPWTKGERLAFGIFDTANDLAESISNKEESVQMNAKKAMNSIYHVKDSYWSWFENETYFKKRISDILFVGRLEFIDKDFENLKKKLNLPHDLKLSTNKLTTHRSFTSQDKKLSQKAVNNLRQWYVREYEFLKVLKEVGKIS